jgi:quinoprotein glucose dehydrogenase
VRGSTLTINLPSLGLALLAFTASAQINDGAKFSALDQINTSNVAQLRPAWTFRTGDLYMGSKGGFRGRASAFETTPLYADGKLFITTAFCRVIALDPLTGKQLWAFDPKIDVKGGYGDFANRGVATWTENGKRRLFIATVDARLIALDAATGQVIRTFGNKGTIDLTKGLRIPVRQDNRSEYEETSPPAVIGDLVVVGSGIADNGRTDMPSGEVRAYDVRSGKLAWTFDPLAGTRTGGANAWSLITPDPPNNRVFVPTGSPSPDYFGGERKGDNRYANSVVALNARTGKVAWFFQTVHHDLWDYDVAGQPALITAKGKPAVAVTSKTGNIFILDRLTGQPVFGVEERPVPKSDVPGEEAAPTQPFATLPVRRGPDRIEPWGSDDADRKWCTDTISKLRYDGVFTPPSLNGSLIFPGNVGGMAWGGVAFDPRSGTLFVPDNRLAAVVRLVPRAEMKQAVAERKDWETGDQSGTPFGMQRTFLLSPKGGPCTPPPWGVIAAIDTNTGAVKWEAPMGNIPFAGGKPELGSIALGGPIATAGGLIFMGATLDPWLKALDSATGKLLWKSELPTSARATPMTFRGPDGRQFVVIAAGGHDVPGGKLDDSLVAFALPVAPR